jgi:GMP synthase-like glutamine amidotransferase
MDKVKVFLTTTHSSPYLKIVPNLKEVHSVNRADLIIFTGGADVSPDLYGEHQNYKTHCNPYRDFGEIAIYNKALAYGIPMLGICRGAQLLTVMAGGTLVQHAENHAIAETHGIAFTDGSNPIEITSTHHQMMYPFFLPDENYELIAYSSKQRSESYEKARGKTFSYMPYEPEIVYYNKINALCIQGHPERMTNVPRTINKIHNLINQYLYDGEKVLQKQRTSLKRVAGKVCTTA